MRSNMTKWDDKTGRDQMRYDNEEVPKKITLIQT